MIRIYGAPEGLNGLCYNCSFQSLTQTYGISVPETTRAAAQGISV